MIVSNLYYLNNISINSRIYPRIIYRVRFRIAICRDVHNRIVWTRDISPDPLTLTGVRSVRIQSDSIGFQSMVS